MPLTFYLCNYATSSDWECFLDDHGDCSTIEQLAEPRGTIHPDIDDAYKHCLDEYLEAYEDPFDGDADDPELFVHQHDDGGLTYYCREVTPGQDDPNRCKLHFVMVLRKIEVTVAIS